MNGSDLFYYDLKEITTYLVMRNFVLRARLEISLSVSVNSSEPFSRLAGLYTHKKFPYRDLNSDRLRERQL